MSVGLHVQSFAQNLINFTGCPSCWSSQIKLSMHTNPFEWVSLIKQIRHQRKLSKNIENNKAVRADLVILQSGFVRSDGSSREFQFAARGEQDRSVS